MAMSWRDSTLFLREAITTKTVCALTPSSLATVKHVCRVIPRDRPLTIVEYGPGTGVFTRYLLEKALHRDSTIVAIDLNQHFIDLLAEDAKAFPLDTPRLILEQGSCTDVREILSNHGLQTADFVLSGIPFSFLDESLRNQVVSDTYAVLESTGAFLVYQYSWLMESRLRKHFPRVDKSCSLLNVPPTFVMTAWKSVEPQPTGSI